MEILSVNEISIAYLRGKVKKKCVIIRSKMRSARVCKHPGYYEKNL